MDLYKVQTNKKEQKTISSLYIRYYILYTYFWPTLYRVFNLEVDR